MTLRQHLLDWTARHSVTALRLSLGLVFTLFGALKLWPGISPAEPLVLDTISALTADLVPAWLALLGTAVLEVVIGLTLLTGRYLRLGVGLLCLSLVGIMSPLVLLPGQLFAGPGGAPTIVGQYVLKDVVLAASAMVVLARAHGARLVLPEGVGR